MSALRLLLVADAVGGVWVYSLELARALKPLGVEAVLAVMGPSPSEAQRAEAADFRLIDTGLPLEWLEADPAQMRRAGQTLAELARREGVDLVQTSSAALLADAHFHVPTVAVQHSCVASWWAAVKSGPLPSDFQWRRELVETGLRRADAVVAPTAAFAAETARFYGVDVLPVHNGRRIPITDLPQGDFVLTAGRLWDEGKNAATLDLAAAGLDVPFQAVGAEQGPNGVRIHLKHMQTIGEIDQRRLSGLLAARPIYASAALYEPFGLSVLEAAGAGCAQVLSDIPTHRELWDGAALFAPARDAQAFAAHIASLMADREDRNRLGELARERAQFYSPERMAGRMARLYSRLLEAAPANVASAA